MMSLYVWILFLHFLADFVFQTNWMAQNKSKRFDALAIHIGAYSFVLLSGLMFFKGNCLPYVLVNGAAHMAVDAVTSRINSRLWNDKRVHGFFVGVGADQFIHAATLLVTTPLLTIR